MFLKYNLQDKKRISGFTLIELMVVVGVIAILSGISVFALNESREAGRDAKRRGDLAQIAQGIEIYKADCNFYPNSPLPAPDAALTGVSPCNPATTNRYIEAMPDDPDTNLNYVYRPLTAGGAAGCVGTCARFQIWTRLENAPALPSYCTLGAPSCGSLACNFCIVNP